MQKVTARLGATIPDDWTWKESHTFLAGERRANVMFSSEPLESEEDATRYAVGQGELLSAEFRGYREIAFEPMKIMGGRNGYMRRFTWEPPDAEPVTQLQLYYAESSRGYTATATTTSSDFAQLEPVLLVILESLTIAGDPGVAAGSAGYAAQA